LQGKVGKGSFRLPGPFAAMSAEKKTAWKTCLATKKGGRREKQKELLPAGEGEKKKKSPPHGPPRSYQPSKEERAPTIHQGGGTRREKKPLQGRRTYRAITSAGGKKTRIMGLLPTRERGEGGGRREELLSMRGKGKKGSTSMFFKL